MEEEIEEESGELFSLDKTVLQIGLAVGLSVGGALLTCLLLFSMVSSGASELKRVHKETAAAAASLSIVIDRQLKVLPRLRVMQGGVDRELSAAARKLREAKAIDERLAAAESFSEVINRLLERLKAGHGSAATPAVVAMLEELHAGERRVAAGRAKYEAELAERAELEQQYGPRLALFLGLAE